MQIEKETPCPMKYPAKQFRDNHKFHRATRTLHVLTTPGFLHPFFVYIHPPSYFGPPLTSALLHARNPPNGLSYSHAGCLNNRLVRSTASSSTAEEEVDDQANDWEEEDEETPEELVERWATRLQDFDCEVRELAFVFVFAGDEARGYIIGDVLKAITSRTRTISPTIPPPLPYFQALPCEAVVSVSSAMTSEKRESWRRMVRAWLNILQTMWCCCWTRVVSATKCRSGL